MKSSGSGGKHRRADQCVIVDGYNVIGRQLKGALTDAKDLESARAWLLEQAAEYRAFTGDDVIVVYDAHRQRGKGAAVTEKGVRVIYTPRHETADDRIERLVYDLRDQYRQLIVATSDRAEQQVAFGGGALRISADEWLQRLAAVKQQIGQAVQRRNEQTELETGRIADAIRQDVEKILEKWRRQ
ncbi:NYN domain-containing protein [Alicyclobacillus cycloheptanicus]|uniref:RNA-binding protein with PIN domain n=1 Tax=Alicyclobacillus cycloheptanicus TaxID=1457 RepID=A0ABT9XJB1_9BACL|nr:NYN domain-containing protein [Alicyclobacillus cycloheptanicus]MDQ0190386.1 putative RNA-binding protein with PIN domain [Alicyclobacillus cycloheptanicus]WDM02628.1 NYN domain-containing protein [Alicyclobacillus cycloheptanicus]